MFTIIVIHIKDLLYPRSAAYDLNRLVKPVYN